MKLTRSRRALAVGGLAAALAVAGTVVAQSQATPAARATAKAGLLAAAAEYLATERVELRAELRKGSTLARIAASKGKSVEGLRAALLATIERRLDARVKAGKLSEDRKQRILARAPARIERLVHGAWRPKATRKRALRGGVLKVAAEYLGTEPRQLVRELRGGRSLAQTTSAAGKSVDGLKAALRSALASRLHAAVAAGRLTPERRDAALAKLDERIARLVERVPKTRRGK